MSEQQQPGSEEATEAAQRVADSVESWEATAEDDTVREELDEGFEEAGVEVPGAERDKLVGEIKDDDDSPSVESAEPDPDA